MHCRYILHEDLCTFVKLLEPRNEVVRPGEVRAAVFILHFRLLRLLLFNPSVGGVGRRGGGDDGGGGRRWLWRAVCVGGLRLQISTARSFVVVSRQYRFSVEELTFRLFFSKNKGFFCTCSLRTPWRRISRKRPLPVTAPRCCRTQRNILENFWRKKN